MNLTDFIIAFNHGTVLSTTDILKAYTEIEGILNVLYGKGAMFETTRISLSTIQYSLKLILIARKENNDA